MNEEDLIEEQIHLSNIVATFQQYTQYTLAANNRRRKDLYTIPREDQELLDVLGYKKKLHEVDKAIDANGRFLEEIVSSPDIYMRIDTEGDRSDDDGEGDEEHHVDHEHTHDHAHDHSHSHLHSHTHQHSAPDPEQRRKDSRSARKRYRPTDFDMDKLRSTLKQFVREWSKEGKRERDSCYEPIKSALVQHFANVPESDRARLRVLVPGAGLGRLPFDVASMGFSCQGNEFSHYMLLASFLVLNRAESVHQWTIYPYVHSFSNLPSRTAMLKSVSVPDVLPSEMLQGNADFSLVAGDFEQVYGTDWKSEPGDEPQHGHWDAILTCFFIDTAKNIVNYLRIIHRLLTPGGVWINLGPLLWHWENNSTSDPSIELDLEEVKELARMIGFTISDERMIETPYTTNDASMLDYTYHAAFWTATKTAYTEPTS